jgi:hypothetical protein
VILRIFNDDRLAEIVLDRSATIEHVLDAMDLVRLMLQHGITAVEVIHNSRAPGEPAINVSPATRRRIFDENLI